MSGEIGLSMRLAAETVSLLSIQHERGAVAGEASTVQDRYMGNPVPIAPQSSSSFGSSKYRIQDLSHMGNRSTNRTSVVVSVVEPLLLQKTHVAS